MLRILREPRWIALLIAVPVGVVLCLMLSDWQWNRWETRKEDNTVQEQNVNQPTAPITSIMADQTDVSDTARWRSVSATGTYDTQAQFLIRRKPLNGANGFWVATPLITDNGQTLVVNRGWIKAGESALSTPDAPAPPSGRVTVVGRLQPASSEPFRATDTPAGQATSVNVEQIARVTNKPAIPAYIDLVTSTPAQAPGLTPIPLPEISEGPHLSYSLQWIAFAIMFIVGLAILIRREVRLRRDERVATAESANPSAQSAAVPQDSTRI